MSGGHERTKSETTPDEHDVTVGAEPPRASSFDLSGKTLGDYAVLEIIGAGGGGQVYKAQHQHMGRVVALKVLPRETTSNPIVIKRFQREVRAAGKLMHPNIVTAFDAGTEGDLHYLVIEYIEGRSLAELIRQDGPMAVGAACRCMVEVAEGIAYAHKMGIVHRDIKPGNIMLATDGRVKILDMGLARLSEMTSQGCNITEHGMVVGSVGYISPEQISNAADVDHRADIYSLGCTLHYLLTGNAPYTGSFVETLVAHAKDSVPSLQSCRSDVPRALDLVFQRMVAKDRERRFQSMEQVADELRRFRQLKAPAPAEIKPAARPPAPGRVKPGSTAATQYVAKSVAIDLGTSSSYVSWIGVDGLPATIPLSDASVAAASLVCFKDGEFKVGDEILADLDAYIPHTATDFVARLGTNNSGYLLDGREFPTEVVAAVILGRIAAQARRRVGYFSHASYTYPSCFGESRRHAYRSAFEIGSVSTVEPINSALASTVYFAFSRGWLNPRRENAPKTCLTLRYGASSFDASLIRIADGVLTTLSTSGDPQFGGHLWSKIILDFVAEQLQQQHGIDVRSDPVEFFKLKRSCEAAKIALAGAKRVPVNFQAQGKALGGVLTRGFLLKSGKHLLDKLEALLTDVRGQTGIEWTDLDHILLTGGTARMPIVRDFIVQHTSQGEKCAYLDPATAPNGAALFARTQLEPDCGSMQLKLESITTHYYAVTAPGANHDGKQPVGQLIIDRNTRLPAVRRVSFRTKAAEQRSIAFQIMEGCDPQRQDGESVGTCQVSNLPPGLPKGAPIELEFHVSENGYLSVFFESEVTGRRSSLAIDRSVGMEPTERARWRTWLDTGLLLGEFQEE